MQARIPNPEFLEQLGYEPDDRTKLTRISEVADRLPADEQSVFVRKALRELWPTEKERFQKTSIIQTKDGETRWMEFRFAQNKFWDDVIEVCRRELLPIRAIVLKGRQLGYSTMVQNLHYFWCIENANRNALTISYDKPTSRQLAQKAVFNDKMSFAPRRKSHASTDKLQFAPPHNSVYMVDTAGNPDAGRGHTLSHLHLSEVPMFPPGNDVLVTTSSHNSVPAKLHTSIIWESTAQGSVGLFYEKWQKPDNFIRFFAPWYWDPEYFLPFPSDQHRRDFLNRLSPDDVQYMERFKLSAEQMRWRQYQIDTMHGNRLHFRQEYPATAEEAFLASGSPVFSPEKVDALRHEARPPLDTCNIMLREAS